MGPSLSWRDLTNHVAVNVSVTGMWVRLGGNDRISLFTVSLATSMGGLVCFSVAKGCHRHVVTCGHRACLFAHAGDGESVFEACPLKVKHHLYGQLRIVCTTPSCSVSSVVRPGDIR